MFVISHQVIREKSSSALVKYPVLKDKLCMFGTMESNNNNIESKKRSPVAVIYETVEEHPEPIDADVTGIKKLLELTFQCLS